MGRLLKLAALVWVARWAALEVASFVGRRMPPR
jgi:hypothetical protein